MINDSVHRLIVRNTETDEDAPAFGIAEIVQAVPTEIAGPTGTRDGESIIEIRKPTGSGSVVAIGGIAIQPGQTGVAYTGRPFARYENGSPTPGSSWAATAGSWALNSGGTGTAVVVEGDNRSGLGVAPNTFNITRVVIGEGSGGGTTSSGRRVMVYDAPAGYDFTDGVAPISSVRCLPITRSGSTLTIDTTASIIDAYPASDAVFDFDSDSCCGGDAASLDFGATFSTPINTINRVRFADAAKDSLVIQGHVNPTSTIDFEVQQLTPNNPPSAPTVSNSRAETDITPDASGLWATTAIDLDATTAYSRGLLLLSITETLANGTTTMPVAHMVISYETTTGTQEDALDFRPDPPVLLTESGGVEDTDRITTDTQPYFRLTLPNDIATDATGPSYELLIWDEDSEIPDRVRGAVLAFDSVRTVEVQAPSTLSPGRCRAQWVTYLDDSGADGIPDHYGGVSDPVSFEVVSALPDPASEGEGARYGKLGYLVIDQDGTNTVFIGGCQHVLSQGEIDALDGTVTATAQANESGGFTTSDDPINFDNFAITSDPTGLAPDPPGGAGTTTGTIAQPDPAVEGVDNALLTLRYEASAWKLAGVGGPP